MIINTIQKIVITVLLTVAISLFAEPDGLKILEIGSKAPDFKLKGIDENYYSLKDFEKAEILIIIFTANHCPTAQAYEDRIIKLVDYYENRNVAFVAVSSNNPDALRLDEMGYTDLGDRFEEMKIRAKDKGYNFPYLYDGDKQEMVAAYGAKTTPHVFIFGRERSLRFVGRIDDSENPAKVTSQDTKNAIEALLKNKEVPVKETKTFGCSIKWADKIPSARKALEQWNREEVAVEEISPKDVKDLVDNTSDNIRLINFWATWCGPCVTEFPHLVEIYRMYRNRNFELLTISMDNPSEKDAVIKFLKKQHASNKNVQIDSEDKYAFIDAVGHDWPGSLPFTMLIKPGGEVIYKKLGSIEPLELKRAIVEELGRYYH